MQVGWKVLEWRDGNVRRRMAALRILASRFKQNLPRRAIRARTSLASTVLARASKPLFSNKFRP